MKRLNFILSPSMEKFIIAVILINAVTLGLETSAYCRENFGAVLFLVDKLALAVFTMEILLKILVLKAAYFKNPWNIFDFIIVGISYAPSTGALSVLRSLRVLRILLLISILPRLRLIVRSLIVSLPSIASIALLMGLLFYVSGVIATRLFSEEFPVWFGTLGDSLFTLFQIMTLESWAMGIVRPILQAYPYAWLFFVPFVLISSFIVLNIFIAVIINSMSEAREQAANQKKEEARRLDPKVGEQLQAIAASLHLLSDKLGKLREEEDK